MKTVIKIAGIPIENSLLYNDTARFLKDFTCKDKPLISVGVTEAEIQNARNFDGVFVSESGDADIEFALLYGKISDSLLKYSRVGFHGVAFMWKQRAWIITALSGVGKTTQYVQWKRLCGDEVEIINGDKPFCEFADDGIIVHSSPWAGKERLYQKISGKLGGIILLEQSRENKIKQLSPREVAGKLFIQFLFGRNNAEDVDMVCRFTERLATSVPIFKLENRGDIESAMLCRDTLLCETRLEVI